MAVRTRAAPNRSHAARLGAGIAVAVLVLLLLRLVGQGLADATKTRGFIGPVFLYLNAQPFVLVFLAVAGGYALGRVKLRGFNLGATAATLVLCLALSVWASLRGVVFNVPEFASTLMFGLFMFAVGMKVGPQFLSGLRREARAFIVLAVLVPLIAVLLMLGVSAVFDLAPGLGPGIFAGANTATPGIGAAKDVYVSRFGATSPALSNLSTAFAFGYCLSLVTFVLMMKVLPRWFGKDAVAESQAYQREIEKGTKHALPGTADALRDLPLEVRAFEVRNPELAGKSIAEFHRRFPNVAVERVRHAGQVMDPSDDVRLELGDVVVLSGALFQLVQAGKAVGPEVADAPLLAVGLETIEVVAGGYAHGKKIDELLHTVGHGFVLNALFRGGTEIPFGPETVVEKGDVFRLTGSRMRIRQFEQLIGRRVVRSTTATDMVTLALGLSVGAILGTLPIPIFGLKLSLGSAVGLLITGIVLSTLRTRNPALGGPFPEPARQLLEDLGLNVFIAITALNAGAGVIAAIRGGAMLPIIVGTLVVGLIPPIAGWAFGQYRHKLNAGLLAGAISGARCSSPGLRIAQEDTKSAVPALSYPVTFAIANVLVTLACYLMATLD